MSDDAPLFDAGDRPTSGRFAKVPFEVIDAAATIGLKAVGLFAVLASYSNTVGVCWPSIPTLQRRSGLSRRHLFRVLDELRRAGLLEVEQGGGTTTNRYTLPPLQTGDAGDTGDTDGTGTGATRGTAPVPPVAPRTRPENKRVRAHAPSTNGGVANRSKFAPPSLEEVRAYCQERGNQVDAQAWIDHYTANGWKVGRNPMRDWKAAVRTWERNGVGQNGKPQPPAPSYAGRPLE